MKEGRKGQNERNVKEKMSVCFIKQEKKDYNTRFLRSFGIRTYDFKAKQVLNVR
jgi:hypothetical protein